MTTHPRDLADRDPATVDWHAEYLALLELYRLKSAEYTKAQLKLGAIMAAL